MKPVELVALPNDGAVLHGRRPWGRGRTACGRTTAAAINQGNGDPTCAACVAAFLDAEDRRGADEPELVDVDVRCGACGSHETRRLRGDDPVRSALAALVCQRCGAREFALAPPRLEEPREAPPHPEEAD